MRPHTTSEVVLANRSGRLPAAAMLGAAPRALWARFRLHVRGWVVLRLPALSKAALIFCCQTPQGRSLRAWGVISGISGQGGDRQLGGLGVRYHASCTGVGSASGLEDFWPFEAKVQPMPTMIQV